MIRVYIAGPLRNKDPEIQAVNIKAAECVAIMFWNVGYNVYCPHLNSGGLVGRVNEETAQKALMIELEMSDIIVFCKGWTASDGSVDEHIKAEALNKSILYEWALQGGELIPVPADE